MLFGVGIAVAVIGLRRYSDAYAWVAHTSDVRMVIGRTLGHLGRVPPSCSDLASDARELGALTRDNPEQQARVPALLEGIDLACRRQDPSKLIHVLGAADASERSLLEIRRDRLAATRFWALLAFITSILIALATIVVSRVLQSRAFARLAESEERFRMLAANASDMIRIHDAHGQATYASPSCERLLGYTPAEMTSSKPLALGHPDEAELLRDTLAAIRKPHAGAITIRYRLRHKDGHYRWFETHTGPVRDRMGGLVRFYTLARDITDELEARRKLEEASLTDELSGMLNRRGFLMMAEQQHRVAVRQKIGIAVVFADLDGLKSINDELGHEAGDRAIRRFGDLLRGTFRGSDIVSRLGGDEFAILVHDVDTERTEQVIERLRRATGEEPGGRLAFSVGISVLRPGDTRSLAELIADADSRMYEQKRARKRDRA
jgi:diguanylate cyclase (GGDEF)-like protein/PAS domain S-box-containing protein